MAKHFTRRIILSCLPKVKLQLLKSVLHLTENSYFTTFVWQKRLLHKNVEVSDHTCEVSSYNEYLINYKPIVHIIAKTLKEILGTTTIETNKIIKANPLLKKRSRTNILNNYYSLLGAGVQKSTIVENIWLLAHENTKLKDKLKCISVLDMKNDEFISWLRLTREELKNYILYIQNDKDIYTYNKIEYLALRLECSIKELCELTIRCSFLLKLPISFIDKKLNILHEYNISNKSILKDLWIFRYSENHIRQRCELYKDTECLEIKTWAIRCPLRIILRAIEKNRLEHGLMQHHKNINDYLMNKLKVDKEVLKLTTAKWPTILRVKLAKLDKLINILQQNGITSNEILQYGRIFYYNVQTIEKRIEILIKQGLIPKLAILMYSQQLFERYIKKHEMEQKLLQSQPNIKDYLIHKLNIDEKTFEDAAKRYPGILQIKILKLVQLIDVLQKNGISSDEILKHGRVFRFKVETLRKRIEILKENGLTPKITVITYSKKSFDQYVKLHKL